MNKICYTVVYKTKDELGFSNESAALITSDFSFGSGTPYGGMTILDGTTVTLTTTNTQPYGATSFRDLLNTDHLFV